VSQFVQRVYVIDLLSFDQYVMLVNDLHVESFPTIQLNKKLDTLIKHTQVTQNTEKNTHIHSRLVNLTNIKFTNEKINTLTLGFNYAIEKDPKYYINELITDTENAIRHLNSKIQNTFWHLATKKVKQIKTTNIHNTLHKRHQHNLNQIKNILQ
jgi:hypothetical protein